MAYPVADSYTAGTGLGVHGGRFAPNAWPAWLAGASVGQWVDMPNSTLTASGVGWSGPNPGGSGSYTAIVNAWGGGVLNTVGCFYSGSFHTGTFMVIFGGGHSDYAGNEVYAYGPFEDDSPAWHRLTDPTIPAPINVARTNGAPVSRHTYDTLVFLPTVNKMLCIGAPGYYNLGFSANAGDTFNFGVDPAQGSPWESVDSGFPAYNGGVGTLGLVSGYDTVTNKAWGLGAGNGTVIGSFDVATSTWTSTAKDNPAAASNGRAAIASSLSLLVWRTGASGAVTVQNLANPSSNLYSPPISGSPPASNDGTLDWDSATESFVCADTSGTVFSLKPGATWAWSSKAATGATLAVPITQGTYGRFRSFAGNGTLPNSLILMRRHDAPICFYKAA